MCGFSYLDAPNYELTTHKSDFLQTDDFKTSFFVLKEFMKKPATMAFTDVEKTFFVLMNGSKYALEAVLMQNNDKWELDAVHYVSCSLTNSKKVYSTFEKEAAAAIFALNKFCIIFWEVCLLSIMTIKHGKWCSWPSSFMERLINGWKQWRSMHSRFDSL